MGLLANIVFVGLNDLFSEVKWQTENLEISKSKYAEN